MTACGPSWLPAQPYADEGDLLCVTCSNVDFDGQVWDWALRFASRRVFEATGGQFTGCMTSKIRPCRRLCSTRADWLGWNEALGHNRFPPALPYVVSDGPAPVLANCWACTCNLDPCTCTSRDRIVLPYRPVHEVTEVRVDGEVFTAWTLVGSRLYRTDGEKWPTCNADEADTEPGTWSVTFTHGLGLPPEAVPLVAAYACEVAKGACGQPCDLPDGIRVISRPGVEFAVLDNDYRRKNLTGFRMLDDWIVGVMGGERRARERPRMWTARRRARRPTHRLEWRHGITPDEPFRETWHLWLNQDFDREVAYEGRTITAGILTFDDDTAEFLVVNATITDGVAFFHVDAEDWPAYPGPGRGEFDLLVQVDGDWDNVVGGPVVFHEGVSDV